jgi:hypothetical protein
MQHRGPSITRSSAFCILVIAGCGPSEPTAAARPVEALPVLVPQVLPNDDSELFWLDATRVAMVGRRTFVWEPDTQRVLSVTLTPGLEPALTAEGLCTDSHCFDLATGQWAAAERTTHTRRIFERAGLRASIVRGVPNHLLVSDTETGVDRLRLAMGSPRCRSGLEAVRLGGALVAYECSDGGGVLTLDGHEVLGFTPGFRVEQLSPTGRWVYVLGQRPFIDDEEGHELQWTGPVLARFDAVHGHFFASLGSELFELIPRPFALSPYGHCAGRDFTPLLEREGRLVVARANCLARSDGGEVLTDAVPTPDAWARDRFVSIAGEHVQVRDLDGLIVSNLALDEGEYLPRHGVTLAMSPDAAWVALAHRNRFRLFDASSGERTGDVRTGWETAGTVFLEGAEDPVLAHLDRGGHRTLFEIPSLTVRAEWDGTSTGDRALIAIGSGLLDSSGVSFDRYDRSGHRIASTEGTGLARAMGEFALVLSPDVALYDPALAVRTALSGSTIRSSFVRDWERPWDEILTCAEGHLLRTDVDSSGVPTTRALDVPCSNVHALDDRWLLISGDLPLLVSPEDEPTEVLVALLDERPTLLAIRHDDDGPHVRSDGIEVMARPARMTSKGMRAVPSEGPIDAFFASP